MRNQKNNIENNNDSPRVSRKSPRLQDPETIRWLRKRYADRARQDYILKQDKHHPESKDILEIFHDLSADKRIITMESLCGYLQDKDIQITNSELSGIISAKSSQKQQQIDITDFERIMMSATLNQKFTSSAIKSRSNQDKQQQQQQKQQEERMNILKQQNNHSKNAQNMKESKRYRGKSIQNNNNNSQLDFKKIRQLSKSVLLEDITQDQDIHQDECRTHSRHILEQKHEQSPHQEQLYECLLQSGKKRNNQIVIKDEMDQQHKEKQQRIFNGKAKFFKKLNGIGITNSFSKHGSKLPIEASNLRSQKQQQSPNPLNLYHTPNPLHLSQPQMYLETPLPQVSQAKRQSLESLVSMIHFERKRDAILSDLQQLQQSSQKGKTNEKIVLMENLIGLSKHSNLSAKRSMIICKQISENLGDPMKNDQINKQERNSSSKRQDSNYKEENNLLENSQSLFINSRNEQSMSLDFSRNNITHNNNQKYHLLSCNELIQTNNSNESANDPGFFEETLNIVQLAKRQLKEDFRYNPPSVSRKACSSSSNQRTAVSSAWSNATRLDQKTNSFSPKLNCKLRLSQLTNSKLSNEGESQEKKIIQKKNGIYNHRDICQDSTKSNTPVSLILTNKFTKNKGFTGYKIPIRNTEDLQQKNIVSLNQFFKSNNRMHLMTARQDKTYSSSNNSSKLHSSAGKHSSLNIVVEDQLF